MKLQKLYSYTRRAADEYGMLEDGDRVAVGISGGKDSLTLLYALSGMQKFYPKKYELAAIAVDLGLGIQNMNKIEELCKSLNVPLYIEKTEIGNIIFNVRNEKNPCSLCAKMRKGALNNKAIELGCNKIAYGHHKDDIIETMMMSLIYEGRINSFLPVTYLERTGLYVIRPLMYVDEAEIIGFKNKYGLPIAKNPCPVDGYTKREYIKQLLKQLNKENPGVKERMFTAILKTFEKKL